MTPNQRRRMWMMGSILGAVMIAVGFALLAFQNNIVYFVTPTEVAVEKLEADTMYRIGGMVVGGSVERDGVEVEFELTDTLNSVSVSYTGVLPDLFREGQGIVANGRIDPVTREFKAVEVLAKHDENYMPPEVKRSLEHSEQSDMVEKFRNNAKRAAKKVQGS